MANYVRNVLAFDANSKFINKVCDFLRSDERLVDLNNIIPVPVDMSASEAAYWQRNNWGTNNAFDCVQNKIDVLSFSTKWVAPEKAIAKLARIFPQVEITLWFADEEIGRSAGMVRWFEGKIIDDIVPFGDSVTEEKIRRFCWESVNERSIAL